MSSSQSYYRKIYERFNKNEPTVSLSDCIESEPDINESNNEINSELDVSYCKYYHEIVLNKEQARNLRIFHNEIVDSYARKINHLNQSTINSYANIVSKFILYSPSLDHNDLEPFIREKFKLKYFGGTFKSQLKGTSRKYFLCLSNFLDHVYSENSYLNDLVSPAQYISKRKVTNLNISPLEIVNAYVELMNSNCIEDAVILHLMYSLGVNPETISFLKFSSIDKNKNIRYFDTSLKRTVKIRLTDRLWNDIEFLKLNTKSDQSEIKYSLKQPSNLNKNQNDFITSLSKSGIFKRFSRGFNGKVGWFDWKPQSIINLSKRMRCTIRYHCSKESLDLIQDSLMITK